MHQRDIERFAFLYLCGPKDKRILKKEARMTFMDFERLTYLTDFFGLADYNLNIWNQFVDQFKAQFEALAEMYHELDLETDGERNTGAYDADEGEQDMWVRDFCRQAPNKELREWLEEQAMEIYKGKGMEPSWQADAP